MNKMEMYKKVIKNESDILKKANISDLGHFVFETQDEMDDFLTSDYVRLGIIGNLNGTLKQIYSEIIPAETKAGTLKSCNITVDEYVCTYYIELNNHSEKVHVMVGTDFSTSTVNAFIIDKNTNELKYSYPAQTIYGEKDYDVPSQYMSDNNIIVFYCQYIDDSKTTITNKSYTNYLWSDLEFSGADNTQVGNLEDLETTDKSNVVNAINEVFQSVSNGKTRIETAITDMGGTVSKSGSVAKTGELISGLATVASAQANIFVQEAEPETKNGLWLKTSNTYDDIVNISGTEDSVTYNKLTDIPYEFYNGSAVVIGNDIYLLGGSAYKKYNYKYDTLTDTYTKMTDIPYDFSSGSAISIGTDIYILGWTSEGRYNYKYDTLTNTYTKMTDIPYEFYKSSAVSIDTDIYLLGSGYNTNSVYPYTKYSYKYNILSNTYTKMTDIPYDFYNGSAVVIGNNIYLLGGQTSKKTNYRIEFTVLDKNSIVFLNADMPFKHKTKMFNTPYGVLNYINFDSVIMTDENGKNINIEIYIGNGTSWNKI